MTWRLRGRQRTLMSSKLDRRNARTLRMMDTDGHSAWKKMTSDSEMGREFGVTQKVRSDVSKLVMPYTIHLCVFAGLNPGSCFWKTRNGITNVFISMVSFSISSLYDLLMLSCATVGFLSEKRLPAEPI